MAQKTEVHYVDDLTGEAADETVQFGLGKITYEIDLATVNADGLRAALAPFVAAGRKLHVRRGRPVVAQPVRSDPAQLRAIRDWARANGHKVADRGRISRTIQDLFAAAH